MNCPVIRISLYKEHEGCPLASMHMQAQVSSLSKGLMAPSVSQSLSLEWIYSPPFSEGIALVQPGTETHRDEDPEPELFRCLTATHFNGSYGPK